MTSLEFVHKKLVEIVELGGRDAATPEKLALEALAVLEPYLERRRQSGIRLLSGVDETCIVKCEEVGEGAYQLRARIGTVEVSEYHFGDPATQTDTTIRTNVRAAILDSLRVELVRDRLDEASDRDILDALDAAERQDDAEVGEIIVAAHDRGIRLLS